MCNRYVETSPATCGGSDPWRFRLRPSFFYLSGVVFYLFLPSVLLYPYANSNPFYIVGPGLSDLMRFSVYSDLLVTSCWPFDNSQGRRSVSNIGGAQSLPCPPVSPSPPSSFPFLPSPPSLCPPPPLLLPSLPFLSPPSPLGVRGLRPRKIFFRYTCSHASFSAFLTQKSAVYLTRFPDNNFAFLQ
jgi:hypothetical protein